MGLLDGFGVTIKKWLGPGTDSGRRVTTQYPEQTRPKPERFHGRHVLNRYADGMEKCIGCELCAGVCPARCIYVRGADNDPDDPTSPGERYGYVYEINYLRCIHCDLCVEACPTQAITESKLFEFAFTNRADAIYTKDELVVGDDGRPQQLPWENWDGGFDPAADTSGWMRATSPSGDADFTGIVAWASELGYGVRAPEGGGTVEPELAEDLAAPSTHDHDSSAAGTLDPGDEAAMAAGTSSAPAFDEVGHEVVVDESTVEPAALDADEPTAGGSTRPAGLFDAPDADEPTSSRSGRRGFGRRKRTGERSEPVADPADDDLLRRPDTTDAGVDTSIEDAAIAESIDIGDTPDVADAGPADTEPADSADDAPADSGDEAAAAPDAGGDGAGADDGDETPPSGPTAGYFDAPEEPEPPAKGRRGRRRRGGR